MKMRMILGVAGMVVLAAGACAGSTTETLTERLQGRRRELAQVNSAIAASEMGARSMLLQGACAELEDQLRKASEESAAKDGNGKPKKPSKEATGVPALQVD